MMGIEGMGEVINDDMQAAFDVDTEQTWFQKMHDKLLMMLGYSHNQITMMSLVKKISKDESDTDKSDIQQSVQFLKQANYQSNLL